MIAPQLGGITKSGKFDLIVHFHGRYPIRKEFVREAKGTVLVGVDLGISSGPYNETFSNPQAFENLIDAVEKEMAKRSGNKKAKVRKLALSSWSAGYGAIEQILRQGDFAKRVDALILLDSVHTGYDDPKGKKLRESGLEPFIEFAKKAKKGRGLMYQTHSSIIPPGYASTREVSHHIVEAVGGKIKSAKRDDLYGLELFERYDSGGYKVRGYRGNDKPDHCAHLGLMREVMRSLINPRWKSPRGRKGKKQISKAKEQAKKSGTIYVVKEGDSLGRIAKRHDITVAALREANGLTKGGRAIRPGDELIIPASDGKAPSKKKKKKSKKKEPAKEKPAEGPKPGPGEKVHTVAKGQSLGAIAKRYNVTVAAIRKRNDIKKGGRRIQPGDKLIIPKK
jgi:LysM repeat protein